MRRSSPGRRDLRIGRGALEQRAAAAADGQRDLGQEIVLHLGHAGAAAAARAAVAASIAARFRKPSRLGSASASVQRWTP